MVKTLRNFRVFANTTREASGGSYQEVSALVLDTSVRAKYQFTKNIGMSFGITYFNSEVTIDEADIKTEVDYGYDGIALGVDILL